MQLDGQGISITDERNIVAGFCLAAGLPVQTDRRGVALSGRNEHFAAIVLDREDLQPLDQPSRNTLPPEVLEDVNRV